MTDAVNHPQHYADHYKREVIELTSLLDFNLGNAVKYILRAPFKGNEAQDRAKAAWYLNHAYTRKKSKVPSKALSIVGDFGNPMVVELLNLFPTEGSDAVDRESLNRGLDALIERLTQNR